MRTLLIDIDSKIPNLALMKLSAWHKRRGDEVFLNDYLCNPDRVYVSCIFTKNAYKVKQLPFKNVIAGGSGLQNWDVRLSAEIEKIKPDYNLYNCEYSLGYTTRGCVRNCPWCVVSKKEGNYRFAAEPEEFYDPKFNVIRFLDNILPARALRFAIKKNLKVIADGMDLRSMGSLMADLISYAKPYSQWHFAWDEPKKEKVIREGLEMLFKAGVKPSKIMVYVLCNFNTSLEEDLYRIKTLRGLKVDPFVMNYVQFNKSENKPIGRVQRELARWCNMYRFKNVPFKKWLKLRGVN